MDPITQGSADSLKARYLSVLPHKSAALGKKTSLEDELNAISEMDGIQHTAETHNQHISLIVSSKNGFLLGLSIPNLHMYQCNVKQDNNRPLIIKDIAIGPPPRILVELDHILLKGTTVLACVTLFFANNS